MAKKNMTDIVALIVAELTPLDSEERHRVVDASLTLLGETKKLPKRENDDDGDSTEEFGDLPARARTWMRQGGLSVEEIQQVFHFGAEGVEVIASEVPGKNNRERVRGAYVLLGIAQLLSTGDSRFQDREARALCETLGIYDHTNHMKHMKGGNEFTGSKDRGWTLTAPGYKHGAKLVAELSKSA